MRFDHTVDAERLFMQMLELAHKLRPGLSLGRELVRYRFGDKFAE